MTHIHAVHVYDTSGALVDRVADFLWLSYRAEVNGIGFYELGLHGDHELPGLLGVDYALELWRRSTDGTWSRQLTGLHRDDDWTYRHGGSRFASRGPSSLALLDKRIVNYPAGQANLSYFNAQPAETILKRLVDFNAGPSALAINGRKRDAVITGISVEADGGAGNTLTRYYHGDELVEALQDAVVSAGGDFELARTGGYTWEFRWHLGQLGTDRRTDVQFSLLRGNMRRPRFRRERHEERTVACVWGQGEDVNRDYTTRISAAHTAIRDSELYVDARNIDKGDLTGLAEQGDARLEKEKATERFEFEAVQTPGSSYGEHYFLGDLVTVVNPFTDVEHDAQVTAVEVELDEDGEEDLAIEVKLL